jgi:hypothetical protein
MMMMTAARIAMLMFLVLFILVIMLMIVLTAATLLATTLFHDNGVVGKSSMLLQNLLKVSSPISLLGNGILQSLEDEALGTGDDGVHGKEIPGLKLLGDGIQVVKGLLDELSRVMLESEKLLSTFGITEVLGLSISKLKELLELTSSKLAQDF